MANPYVWRVRKSTGISKVQCPETPSQLLPFTALPPNGGESCNAKINGHIPLLHFPWGSFTRLEGWQSHGVIKGTDLYTRIQSAQSWMHLRILIAIKELGGNLSGRPGQSKQKSEVLRQLDIVSAELLEWAGTNYHFSLSYLEQQYGSYGYEFKVHLLPRCSIVVAHLNILCRTSVAAEANRVTSQSLIDFIERSSLMTLQSSSLMFRRCQIHNLSATVRTCLSPKRPFLKETMNTNPSLVDEKRHLTMDTGHSLPDRGAKLLQHQPNK